MHTDADHYYCNDAYYLFIHVVMYITVMTLIDVFLNSVMMHIIKLISDVMHIIVMMRIDAYYDFCYDAHYYGAS